MCGIAGLLRADAGDDELVAAGYRMADSLVHRGPDDAGVWSEDGLVLAHRRLAVIDLSPEGHQPMVSRRGRFVIVFNGEIYNYRALRQRLVAEGVRFHGHSDTEVLLEAIAEWGLDAALEAAVGMFAVGVWDRSERVLSLARDRFGEKPLYLASRPGLVVFASELKAIRVAGFPWTVDRDAVRDVLSFGYIPAPRSILAGVEKLRPGEIVEIRADDPTARRSRSYWTLPTGAWRQPLDREALVDELEKLVREAVSLRMVADVPLGAFLSGGIDSSLVVATMQEVADRPVRTFTIGFAEAAYDEARHARAVARHLGTDHTELYVSPADSLDVIPKLADIYDEPFADMSQIPTYLVSELARRSVTVSLSGDGGDELFGGYDRYGRTMAITARIGRVPRPVRSAASTVVAATNARLLGTMLRPAHRVLRGRPAPPDIGHKAKRLGALLRADGDRHVYDGLVRHWHDADRVVAGATRGGLYGEGVPASHGFVDWMMRADLSIYLPDDILVKVDRASMAVSLESRVPLLDPAIAEFALRLPSDLRRSASGGKELLRDVLARKVPRNLFERPKMGFGVPMDEWLRGPLRAWADALLDPSTIASQGLLDAAVIRRTWQEHLSGERNWQYLLWDVLILQAWLDRWSGAPAA